MKEQSSSSGKRAVVLILALSLVLMSHGIVAQTPQFVYTVNSQGTVSEVDTSTDSETQALRFAPSNGLGIAITDDNAYVLATTTGYESPDAIARIDLSTYMVSRLPTHPRGYAQFVAITPPLADNCRYAYVTTGTSAVDIVNLCTGLFARTVTLPSTSGVYSYGVDIAPDGTEAWVTAFDSSNVFVINTASFNVETIAMPGGAAGPARPGHTAFAYVDPDQYSAYITDRGANNRRVLAVSGTAGARTVTSIQWDTSDPRLYLMYTYAIDINPNTLIAYATWSGSGNILPAINLSVTPPRPFYYEYPANSFNTPRGVAWLADGRAYVGNQGSDSMGRFFLTAINANPLFPPTQKTISGGNPYWLATTK